MALGTLCLMLPMGGTRSTITGAQPWRRSKLQTHCWCSFSELSPDVHNRSDQGYPVCWLYTPALFALLDTPTCCKACLSLHRTCRHLSAQALGLGVPSHTSAARGCASKAVKSLGVGFRAQSLTSSYQLRVVAPQNWAHVHVPSLDPICTTLKI